MRRNTHVGIVGGGVAGVTAALILGSLGCRVTLFERNGTLVDGPPFCHLHAGGNLYREISDEQCVTLMRQSIEFARLYPFVVDRRPTVIAVPTSDEGDPEALLPRLRLLRNEYEKLVAADPANEVLGDPADYFTLFGRFELEKLAQKGLPGQPASPADWMVPVARSLDFKKLKFPLVLVQEYGLNLFRMAGAATLALETMENVDLRLKSRVAEVVETAQGYRLRCEGQKGFHDVDYLINAAGFRTGEIDDMLGIRRRRMVEFKAAYTAHWPERKGVWPEMVFHGRRGTPRGMGQFTPYPKGYVQLHGMTKDITLFEHGLVANAEGSSQPKLGEKFVQMIEKGWPDTLVQSRTRRAVAFLARYLPSFATAEVGGPPLFGAQQIPGEDPTLRVAEVIFPRPRYACCEIVKVSSVTDMAEAIVNDLAAEGLCDGQRPLPSTLEILSALDEEAIAGEAVRIATARGYPAAMAGRNVT
ncbi:NAD-binding protein [Hydrogenimonas urashimensis]|uniref:NAD-binding protein n=1 Tax=Hydrogenimonas urashimensis TaxID=2740515 RepID=UPI001916B3A0|nr:NAD-binding protein [Hydrogenimonas urashimensis]